MTSHKQANLQVAQATLKSKLANPLAFENAQKRNKKLNTFATNSTLINLYSYLWK